MVDIMARMRMGSRSLMRFSIALSFIFDMNILRHFPMTMLTWVNPEPRIPPPIPMRIEGKTAITLTAIKSLDVNFVLNSPKSFLYLKPWKEELRRSVVKVAVMQQKNTCHESLFFQKEDTSSIANKSPPTGAPKADAIPAAAPADMKFLLSSEFLNLEKQGMLHSNVADLNWLIPAATKLPR
uniref:Uncharacterized protein n=1 Tax=Lepeophtheirus salmonis TaxID=72036 RepID=A0A0K2SV93_LEPSM